MKPKQPEATSWLSNIVPGASTTNNYNSGQPLADGGGNVAGDEQSPLDGSDPRGILSPMKPVNLLPQVPINSNSRKLSDNEEHDCEVIGEIVLKFFYSYYIIVLTLSIMKNNIFPG